MNHVNYNSMSVTTESFFTPNFVPLSKFHSRAKW